MVIAITQLKTIAKLHLPTSRNEMRSTPFPWSSSPPIKWSQAHCWFSLYRLETLDWTSPLVTHDHWPLDYAPWEPQVVTLSWRLERDTLSCNYRTGDVKDLAPRPHKERFWEGGCIDVADPLRLLFYGLYKLCRFSRWVPAFLFWFLGLWLRWRQNLLDFKFGGCNLKQ
jgi:hypothetical protein